MTESPGPTLRIPAPRRAASRWLAALLTLCCLVGAPTALAADPPRIATLDWTLAETLQALGTPPEAVAQVDAYHAWVGEPHLPGSVTDLGLRTQPNLELLSDLAPDQILISPMFANLKPRLSRIAPVQNFTLYTPGRDTWQEMRELTHGVAELVGRPEAADRLIESTETRIAELRRQLPDDVPPLLVVQFMDARHVRVFGDNGLYQAVLERLGLDNAWPGKTNAWGFSLTGIEALANLDARLVVVEPYPAGVHETLEKSGLWQGLIRDSRGDPLVLPPVWSFGALPSAQRFAEQLTAALESPHAR
ncbi:iron-siderophore ABC transporter substrate-binding protein [Halomonas elongata]|uniref:iron-siderophore ABC transporter substrate-binding protein n=1 Tax=Halomonas elongata TaxID=2746 RepID=UPI00255AE262|nr:iron-siderophore ABC transporter substrate-binding protein [Halomonas elongata]MDL4863585.1 iron-siderophore ABC transporter substrate-binding protein [Halomonas elongata]